VSTIGAGFRVMPHAAGEMNSLETADPADSGMLDVVGFDTATPQLISDFARGAL
jgi:hypothetical protein